MSFRDEKGNFQFDPEGQPRILKDDFSSRTDPSIFTSAEPLLLD